METNQKAYCVKCNNWKPKGKWVESKVKNPYIDIIHMKHGHRKLLRGFCDDCGCKVSRLIKNNPMEVENK